jgi:hypothetical protein
MWASILLFEKTAEQHRAVANLVRRWPTGFGSQDSVLCIVGTGFMECAEFQGLHTGHVLRARTRHTKENAPSVGYFFVDPKTMIGLDGSSPFEVLCMECAVLCDIAEVRARRFHLYLRAPDVKRRQGDLPARFGALFTFRQYEAFPSDYRRGRSFFLDHLSEVLSLPFPDGKNMTQDVVQGLREFAEMPACEHCGAVLVRGMPAGFCCRPIDGSMVEHLPHPMPESILNKIKVRMLGRLTFPRILNCWLRPVIQNARISSHQGSGSSVFITGIPYALDTFRQFETPVYAICHRADQGLPAISGDCNELIDEILKRNEVLRGYVRENIQRVENIAVASIVDPDEGTTLAIFNTSVGIGKPHEIEAIKTGYRPTKLPQHVMVYDKLVYPLIFWDGHGGCGAVEQDQWRGATLLIRKSLISLVLQPRDHFIHSLATLREEFICAVAGRLANIRVKFLAQAQHRQFSREDEIRGDLGDSNLKEYGLRTFIPSSLTDSNEYWKEVATKCFTISTQFGAPTFFLTFTMNPYWADFQALKRSDGQYSDSSMAALVFKSKIFALMKFIRSRKILGTVSAFVWRIEYQRRGLPHAHVLFWSDYNTADVGAVEEVVNVHFPKDSPFLGDQELVLDFRNLIKTYQLHTHSPRCRTATGACRYGYPHPAHEKSTIVGHSYVFARSEGEENIVPHNPEILAAFRCHHCLEVIHSDQCIGYVLKYCSKNSDDGEVSLNHVLYEGRPVRPGEKLEHFAATRISSACECFAGICGFWRHHIKPAVEVLNIHLEGQKIVWACDQRDAEMKIDLPSRLERYFGRPNDEKYDNLTYTDYYSQYNVVSRPGRNMDEDVCIPTHFVSMRKSPIICVLNSVRIHNTELFALRLLLRLYPARSWEELRARDGVLFDSHAEMVKYLGLVQNTDDEARIALNDALAMNRPPSEIRFLFAQVAPYVADTSVLEQEFWPHFFDAGDTDESVRVTLHRLFQADDYLGVDQFPVEDSGPNWSHLTGEQRHVAGRIFEGVVNNTGQLFFLQGSAGTGKTWTVRVLTAELRRQGKKCLITGTTGIAAVQYAGGTTVHSLFKLGIDEMRGGEFRSNIGRGSFHAEYLLSADLIIIDEVSMLTPWVANRVSLTLKSISDDSTSDFGGMKILFVGDLLQLPPVIQGFSSPMVNRLIVRISCWHAVQKFCLWTPIRTPDLPWARFLLFVARGEMGNCATWKDLEVNFGVRVTDDLQCAQDFFCSEIRPEDIFPLDRQWICPTNRLVNEVNGHIQNWRSEMAEYLGTVYATTNLITPLPESPGLSICQQIDFIEKLDTPDLPMHAITFFRGDAFVLLRNIDTRSGMAKGRRCFALALLHRAVVVKFDDGVERTLTRIPMEKVTNGMKFQRWQIPLKLVFAGTVHRAQGTTLSRSVVDCRSNFWEHGQLYVALSRVRDPHNLCILLDAGRAENQIKLHVDKDVVRVVENMGVADVLEASCCSILPDRSQNPNGENLPLMGPSLYDGFSEDELEPSIDDIDKDSLMADISDPQFVPDIGDDIPENQVHTLPLYSFAIRTEPGVALKSLIARAVRFSRKSFSECIGDDHHRFSLVRVCFRTQVLFSRILAVWRWAKQNEGSNALNCQYHLIKNSPRLLNTQNNCYVNAFLQLLFHIIPMQMLVLAGPGFQPSFGALQRIFQNMTAGRPVTPLEILQSCKTENNRPQDCGEFGMRLLETIYQSVSPFPGLLAMFDDLFRIRLNRVISSYDMGDSELTRMENCSMIILSVVGYHSLGDAIRAFFAPVKASDVHTERVEIEKLPLFFFLQIQRATLNRGHQKDCHRLDFPLILDMSEYVSGDHRRYLYDLSAVVAHIGPAMDGGHYIAFCKTADIWICFNDDNVTRTDEKSAVHENFPESVTSTRTAHILLYIRQD